MPKIGLIAGNGELPLAVVEEARSKGYEIVVAALEPLADTSVFPSDIELKSINVGKLGALIDYLKKAGIREAVMAGKVPKSLLYKSKITPDLRAIRLLFGLKDKSDDSILLALAKELKKDGITLLNTTDFTTSLITPEGILTREGPSENEWKDIAFGWKIAKEIGRLDIGQTIVVKDQAVMAVEAIEGTDEAIKRGGALANGNAVVIKVSKPQQDMRFDVPVIGPDTLSSMITAKARVLAVEAGKSIILNKTKLLSDAEEAGIAIVGINDKPAV